MKKLICILAFATAGLSGLLLMDDVKKSMPAKTAVRHTLTLLVSLATGTTFLI